MLQILDDEWRMKKFSMKKATKMKLHAEEVVALALHQRDTRARATPTTDKQIPITLQKSAVLACLPDSGRSIGLENPQ